MKIQMFHRIKGVSKVYPPVMGVEYTPYWVDKVREEIKTHASDKFSVLKCPGIFELFNRGFYVPLPYDIEITAREKITYKHTSFKVENIPVEVYDETDGLHEEYMSVVIHDENTTTKHFPRRKGTHEGIMNLKTGWNIISPVPLLFLPIPYPDRYDFESSYGILDTKKDANVNAQIYINEEQVNIRSGEHIMFIVPLTESKMGVRC